MNKIVLSLILTVSAISNIFSQSTAVAPATYKNEIGVDVTLLLANLFGFRDYYYVYDIYGGYGTPNAGLYLITYKHYFGNSALRFGAGADVMQTNTTTDASVATNESTNNRFDLRLGYEFEQPLGDKWNLYYGLDLLMNMSASSYKYEDPNNLYSYESSTNTTGFGGGPLVGISWKINQRIKLSTEANLQYTVSDAAIKTTYSSTPESNYEANTKTTYLNANYPMFLYLEFLF